MGFINSGQTLKRRSGFRWAPVRLAVESYFAFYRELSRRFDEIGSILPSSKALAEDMTSVLNVRPFNERPTLSGTTMQAKPAIREILEVGPGTGPFTREILTRMRPHDYLTVCEINSTLLSQLQKSLYSYQPFFRHANRVNFIQSAVQDLPLADFAHRFDVIICGLPFSSFEPETAEVIMQRLHNYLKPGGRLVFFEYWGFREIFGFLNTSQNRRRLRSIDKIIDRWESLAEANGQLRKHVCFQNIPPAKVVDLQFLEQRGS